MRIRHVCGLLALLLLSAALLPSPAQAGSTALEWRTVDKPGITDNIVISPSEVSEIAIGSNSVLYVLDSQNSKVYRSLDAGVTWEDITLPLLDAGATLPASKIAIAPDKAGIIGMVTNNGTKVYLSTDGGMEWTDTAVPSLPGTIQAIAISEEYTQGRKSYREIAIGTAAWGDSATTGQIWVRQFGSSWPSWQNQNLTIDPAHTGGEVSALAYSPKYSSDSTLLAIASTASDVATAYQNKTWLCLLERDTSTWNNPAGYPVEIAPAGDASGVSGVYSSLALPSNYSSDEASSRQLFVSYDRTPDANDDIYRLNDTTLYRLNADGGTNIDISSIAYHGTRTSGTLLAGDVSPITGSLTVQVRRTANPFDPSPTWYLSTVPPTGPGNAKVGWSPDGKAAYCGTGQSPGAELDESAFSASLDGDKWRQLGLMDTAIKLSDIIPAPDSKSLFAITYSQLGPEGIWRSASGKYWERLLSIDASEDAIILRLSPNYSDDYTMYAAEIGGNQLAVSHDRGNSWRWFQGTPGPIIDMVVGDEDTVYVALPGGYVKKSINGALTWRGPVPTGLPDINMLALVDKEMILVGGERGDVSYSSDGGESFTRIPEVIGSGSGDVQVIADVNYPENSTIYAATNLPDEGIWRWVIGVSTEWEQIDESITELAEGQCIGGLTTGPEGTLYALRTEPVTGTGGGVTRSLNPLAPDPKEVEFDQINQALPAGATFDPTTVFPNTLPYLKLSGNAEQNELWTIDTTNKSIYRFQDTLCKLGPTLVMPEAGETIPIDSSGYVTSLTLSWEELAGAMSYEAVICPDLAATERVWSEVTTALAVSATRGNSPAQLFSGTTYYWRVRSVAPIKSPWSQFQLFTPALGVAQWSPLAAPTGISPPPGATNIPVRPAFAWQPADWATGYEFILARDSEFTDVVTAMTGADALPGTVWRCDGDLDYATTYFWKVRATSTDSSSQWGISVFTTEDTSASPPPAQSPPPSPSPTPTPSLPYYLLGTVIGIGIAIVVALVVLIVRTGR